MDEMQQMYHIYQLYHRKLMEVKESMEKSYVVITHAGHLDYQTEYVSLPKDYGKTSYYQKEEVAEIIKTVHQNLHDLNKKTHFSDKIKNKKVLIKPNLVTPYYKMGYKDDQYPETTDPRVFDAVVSFIKQFTEDIVIVESSGRGMPTNASFKIAGYDRIAKHHDTGLIALEEQPLDRYMLPKAEVMKEIFIPRIFSEVVRGKAFYISVPKMKTNLYTGVTLGFKNAMGTIPYNLRQRNHNHAINKKLVDMLFLFKPDLVVIDGIIGGEGNTPAPVDPVDSRVIVSGDNSVETDWVATKMMGINPDEIELMTQAKKLGFGNDNIEVIGEQKVTSFRQADQSLTSDYFHNMFPNVKVLVGHTKSTAPKVKSLKAVTNEMVREIEKACIGGCIASLRTGFDYLYYQSKDLKFKATVVVGEGIPIDGKTYYFDRDANAYNVEEIKSIKEPIINFGSCTQGNFGSCKNFISAYGCMPKPGDGFNVVFKAAGTGNDVFSLKNKQIFKILVETLKTRRKRLDLVKAGEWADCLPTYFEDKIFELPQLTDEQKQKDYIPWDLPKIEDEIKETLVKDLKPIL